MDSEVLFIKKFRCRLPCVKLSVLAKLFSIFQESLEDNIVINKGLLFFSVLWQKDQWKELKVSQEFWLLILEGFQSIGVAKAWQKCSLCEGTCIGLFTYHQSGKRTRQKQWLAFSDLLVSLYLVMASQTSKYCYNHGTKHSKHKPVGEYLRLISWLYIYLPIYIRIRPLNLEACSLFWIEEFWNGILGMNLHKSAEWISDFRNSISNYQNLGCKWHFYTVYADVFWH